MAWKVDAKSKVYSLEKYGYDPMCIGPIEYVEDKVLNWTQANCSVWNKPAVYHGPAVVVV